MVERVILYQIEIKNDIKKKLSPDFLSGFKAEHSCKQQALRFTERIFYHFGFHHTCSALFLDIQKAFDRVWHHGLTCKLTKLKFHIFLTKLIHFNLQNRTFRDQIFHLSFNNSKLASPRALRFHWFSTPFIPEMSPLVTDSQKSSPMRT